MSYVLVNILKLKIFFRLRSAFQVKILRLEMTDEPIYRYSLLKHFIKVLI